MADNVKHSAPGVSEPSPQGMHSKMGFLTHHVDNSFTWLGESLFCLGGYKTRLDCGPRGMGSDTPV